MSKLSISRAWEETQQVLAHDGRLLASVALALVLLPEVVANVIVPSASFTGGQPPLWIPVLFILVSIAGLVAQIAIMRLALGPATSVGDAISHGVRRFLPGLGAILLFGFPLAILLGLSFALLAGPAAAEALRTGAADPASGRILLLLLFVLFLVSARFQLILPVAAAESGGPLRILRRALELSSGHYLRLVGFLLAMLVTGLIVLFAAQFLGGIIAQTLFGDPKALSVSALVVALVNGVVKTAFVVVLSTLLARIYAQLAGVHAAQVGVPKSGI